MPEQRNNQDEIRIGAYTCHCGGNISDVVNCERVAKAVMKLTNVVVSRTDLSMCSDAGQAMIESDIAEYGINRVVIGACAPSLHEATFRGTVARAGINPYLYHHVGLREQTSWVHGNNPEKATQKAIRLMAAGIAKARHLDPLEPIKLNAEKHALVIGGGIAGLRSALDMARMGLKVSLIEKSPFLGGHTAQLENVFPNEESARGLLSRLINQVTTHKNIALFLRAELVGLSGYVGDYHVEIRQQSRGVTPEFKHPEKAIDACPIEVPDQYNYGLTMRKAIYTAYGGCYPQTPAIDWENCNSCEECKNLNGTGIELENKPRNFKLRVGAITVATGFNLYTPPKGEYGYDEIPEVITLAKFIRLMALTDEGKHLTWNDHPVRDIAMVHCVGSRHIDGIHEPQADGQVNDYCSRVCCTATLHTANEIKDRYPEINIYDLYEDIRTYGRGHEEYYNKTLDKQVRFLRFHGDENPRVEEAPAGDTHPVLIKVKDYLTQGKELEIPVDLVVLAVGFIPPKLDDLIKLLKISPGTDRFLLEVHPKLRPVETAVPGVVLAGTAQGPMNIQESCAAASAAAAKVAALLGQGFVELEPFVAQVNPNICDGAGECLKVCAYEDAIRLEFFSSNGHQGNKAVVTPANCAGCGSCVSACPNGAIDIQGWTIEQYDAQLDALVMEVA